MNIINDLPNDLISYITQKFINENEIADFRLVNKKTSEESLKLYSLHNIKFKPALFIQIRSNTNSIKYCNLIKKLKPGVTNIYIEIDQLAIFSNYDIITFVNLLKNLKIILPNITINVNLVNLYYEYLIILFTEILSSTINSAINFIIHLNRETFPFYDINNYQKLDNIICNLYENDIIDIQFIEIECHIIDFLSQSKFIKYITCPIQIKLLSLYNNLDEIKTLKIQLKQFKNCSDITFDIVNLIQPIVLEDTEFITKITFSSPYLNYLTEFLDNNNLKSLNTINFVDDITSIRFDILSNFISKNKNKIENINFSIINDFYNNDYYYNNIINAILIFNENNKTNNYNIYINNVISYCIARIINYYICNTLKNNIKIEIISLNSYLPKNLEKFNINEIINMLKQKSDFHYYSFISYINNIKHAIVF
jgi:hypothetical protein